MASPEHVEIVKQGADAIENWREENPDVRLDLDGAQLGRGTGSSWADLSDADLSGANLSGADLSEAILNGANLSGADLSKATFAKTMLGRIDLSVAKGLNVAKHNGHSTIGVDTLYMSKGKIPEAFLRGCGVPDELIAYLRSLLGGQ